MKKLLFPVIVLSLVLLMAVPASASIETIWEIGLKDGYRNEFTPDSITENLYIVGTSGLTDFPGCLDFYERTIYGPKYVEIEFTTAIPYIDMSLLYCRMGGETDEVWLDETSLGTCYYLDDPHPSEDYPFPVVGVVPGGEHTIKIECLGNVDYTPADGAHYIDYLKLTGDPVEPTVMITYRSEPDEVDVGEEASWTITIQICGDDEVDLSDVVVQGGIGADLVVTHYYGPEVTFTKKGKGKMGATIVKWDIGTLESGVCITLNLEVETGENPKGKQEFTSAELGHELDGGFSATYWYDGMEYKTPETDPLTVDVVE